jgi:nucleoside-diphosphate-sugar epimerase
LAIGLYQEGKIVNAFMTGTGSFVGKELTAQCEGTGIELSGCDVNAPLEGKFTQSDIRSKDIADIIPENVDAVVHLAALSTDPMCRDNANNCFDVNVMGTLNLMEAAQTRKAKQFIFASTEWVYDAFADGEIKDEESLIDIQNISSEYALSKIVSEQNLRQKFNHGLCPVTVLRFGIIYGPRESNWSAVEALFNSVKTDDEITVGSLKTGRCFIHVSDIARGILKAIGIDGFNIVNLEGDRLITLGDVIEISKKIWGRNPTVTEKDPGNPSIRNVSCQNAKQVLDWQPKITLNDGLKSLM